MSEGLTPKAVAAVASKASPGFLTTLYGIAAATLTGAVTALVESCPSVISLWPTFMSAGVAAGLGFWLRSPKK